MDCFICIKLDLDDEDAERSLYHELLHVVLSELNMKISDIVDAHVPESSKIYICKDVQKEMEKIVIRLERAQFNKN